MGKTRISVVVCTLNEEATLERFISKVGWADEVLVLDSGSQDRTRELAQELGASVHHQSWLGFSAQKNRAAQLARNDWVLSLDADELVSPELARSIERVASEPMDPRDGYVVDRRGEFLGVVLPNAARRSKRSAFVRLYNRRHGGWNEAQEVHEEVLVPGRLHPVEGPLLHWNLFTLDEQFTHYNRYATIEARALWARGRRTTPAEVLVRPVLRFLWNYLVRGEARLGGHGLVHSGLRATSEFMRFAKLWELQQEWPRAASARGESEGGLVRGTGSWGGQMRTTPPPRPRSRTR